MLSTIFRYPQQPHARKITAVSSCENRFGSTISCTKVRGWRDGSLIPATTFYHKRIWSKNNSSGHRWSSTPPLHKHHDLQPVQCILSAEFVLPEDMDFRRNTQFANLCQGGVTTTEFFSAPGSLGFPRRAKGIRCGDEVVSPKEEAQSLSACWHWSSYSCHLADMIRICVGNVFPAPKAHTSSHKPLIGV